MNGFALQIENQRLRKILKWACDTEDVDFFSDDHPDDPESCALLRKVVIGR